MGRIKTALIKRVTKKLVAEHGEKLTTDFDKNKLIVEEVAEIPSKKLRNVVTGYATRLTKKKRKEDKELLS